MLHIVRDDLFHGPQSLGEWTFLQSSTFLQKHTCNDTDLTMWSMPSEMVGMGPPCVYPDSQSKDTAPTEPGAGHDAALYWRHVALLVEA